MLLIAIPGRHEGEHKYFKIHLSFSLAVMLKCDFPDEYSSYFWFCLHAPLHFKTNSIIIVIVIVLNTNTKL